MHTFTVFCNNNKKKTDNTTKTVGVKNLVKFDMRQVKLSTQKCDTCKEEIPQYEYDQNLGHCNKCSKISTD